jgi:hypothetical protein
MAKKYMLVQFAVEDFSSWKSLYDQDHKDQQKAGLKELHLLRNIENPNGITLLFEIEDVEKAKEFVSSPATRERIEKARIVGDPDISFLS